MGTPGVGALLASILGRGVRRAGVGNSLDGGPRPQPLSGRYREQLRTTGLVDLAEEVGLAGELLDDPTLVRQLGVRHLLVDEVQNLDAERYHLVTRLALDAQTAVLVGDARQSIYGFRSADPIRPTAVLTDLDATVVYLAGSHRCRQPILDAASMLVVHQVADVPCSSHRPTRTTNVNWRSAFQWGVIVSRSDQSSGPAQKGRSKGDGGGGIGVATM